MVRRSSVGVVIPAFNAERFLRETLESVDAQTRAPDRVVVVDDGSEDGTVGVVEDWASATDLTVELISQENRGVSSARNIGIDHLSSDLIAFLDADDVWEPHHLGRTVEALEREGDLILCFANHQPFDRSGPIGDLFLGDKRIAQLSKEKREGGVKVIQDGVYASLLTGNYIPPSTTVVCRDRAGEALYFDPDIRRGSDLDYYLNLSKVGPFGYFSERHAWYRRHENNMSHPRREMERLQYAMRIRLKSYAVAAERGLSQHERRATRQALMRTSSGLLYEASRHGIASYFRNALPVLRSPGWPRVLSPKDWLRAVVSSLPLIPGLK